MKAIVFDDYGGVDVLRYREVEKPEPGADEVLVAVRAAAVNPADWKIRGGWVREFVTPSFPAVPGGDIAGVVASVGPGVSGFKPGDAVFAMLPLLGGYAEFAVANAAALACKPATIDFVQAASVPLAALTAWQALFDVAGLRAGQRVLIHAAAGGVGGFAVQIARWKGAEVIATASEVNHEYLRGLGAVRCIDYRTTKFENEVSDADVVLDLLGGEITRRSMVALKPGGVVVSVAEPPALSSPDAGGRRNLGVFVQPNGAQLAEIGRLIDAGVIRTEVAAEFALRDAAQAHDLIERHHTRGKIVLRIGE